jgi:hypothetical protein
MKIYNKRGATNYKEKRLIAEITNSLSKKSVSFEPANSFEELQQLHDKICGDFDEYEEIKEDSETDFEQQHKEFRQGMAETMKPNDDKASTIFTDPFNDAEPIVRDYVLSEDFESKEQNTEPTKTTFEEPTSFEESFELPTEEAEKSNAKQSKDKKEQKQPAEKVNPRFDDMSSSKKRRSTKKLAQMIVQGACILAEKGCVWWTTKDITEDKLVQYELENTMDLQILLTLEEGQQITIREWFRAKVGQANDGLFRVSEEDKNDLADSLFEVLMEKGIAPTPMQELMINAVKTFVLDMGLKAIAFRSEIKSVLNQLVIMSNEDKKPSAFEKEAPVFSMKQEEVSYQDIDDTIIENPVVESNINVPISAISMRNVEDFTEISESEI